MSMVQSIFDMKLPDLKIASKQVEKKLMGKCKGETLVEVFAKKRQRRYIVGFNEANLKPPDL